MQDQSELLRQIAGIIHERREPILNDSAAVFPFAGPQAIEAVDCARACELVLGLLSAAIRDGHLDGRDALLAEVRSFWQDHSLGVHQLFGLIYLVERTTLDELALDENLGPTSDQWPAIAQLVRHGSFNCLAAFTESVGQEYSRAIFDPLTTVHTRAVLDAVLEKELHRAERFGHPLALILLDVDRLADLNTRHGYGFGDRVLERIGIVMRSFFREHDWVTRHAGDSFVVILPETAAEHARLLAENVRVMVEKRLALRDHRTEETVRVTVSVAVLTADSVSANIRPGYVVEQAEQAILRAKQRGRNRVERLDLSMTETATYTHEDSRRPQIS